MSNILHEAKFIMTDMDANKNKYWYAAVMDDGSYIQENGRVGAPNPQRRTKNLGVDGAIAEFNKKCKEKQNKGYKEAKILSGTSAPTTVSKSTLESVAIKEIDHNSPEVSTLIKKLSQANIHDIIKSSGITYDEKSGDFRTPLGIVTQDGIDSARLMLNEISELLNKKTSFLDQTFKKLTNSYMEIIPQNVGRHQNSRFGVEDVFPDQDSIAKQINVLDALDASLQKVITSNVTPDQQVTAKLFSVKLNLITDTNVFNRINSKFKATLNRSHTSSGLKLKRVFSVEIDHMKKAFDKKVVSIGNVMELWHGTRTANLLSILKGGLMIPKSGAPHVTGRMFADGVYFSDQSTKSLNYSQGYWSGSRDNNCYMFLADVAMGKAYTPPGPTQNLPKKGYDSTFAKAGQSGVINNEMIVYSIDQCNLTYLCEFEQ